MQERTSVFEKAELTPKAKEKWSSSLSICQVKKVHRTSWRSQLVTHFFEELDTKNLQANRQRMNDTDKSISPSWAVNKNPCSKTVSN